MINKVGMSTTGPSDEQKQIAKSNNLDWDRYVQEIEDLKTNPPRMFEVTIPYFTWYPQAEFPAWHASSLIATGVSKNNIPPIYDKQLVVTEPSLKILQNQVPEYLKDIIEIDPRTEEPLVSKDNVDNTTSTNTQPQQTASTSGTTPTSSTTTKTTQLTETTSQPKQSTSETNLNGSESFDFTKLSPSLQETALRLAEQLLTAALQRLSGVSQTDAQLSTLFDQTN